MANSADQDQLASPEICIGRVYPDSAGQGLNCSHHAKKVFVEISNNKGLEQFAQ